MSAPPPILSLILLLSVAMTARAQLAPATRYVGVNRPVMLMLTLPPQTPPDAPLEIALFDAAWTPLARCTITAQRDLDLASLFPAIWTSADWPLSFAQLIANGEQVGPPVVLQPMDAPSRAEDGLASRVRSNRVPLEELAALPKAMRVELAEETIVEQVDAPVRSGVRLWIDQRIVLDTDAGEIELALHPGAAPNTCAHVLDLVQGGLYNEVPFHRVIAADAQGRPFIIQTGDPTGTGAGGCGQSIDFEPSTLPHDFGVVSMARKPDDPNSASSQFFICLSREGCASLDGRFTAFATVVRGEATIATIAATPTGTGGRPVDPPMLRRAYAIDAPPIAARAAEAPPEPAATAPTPR